MFVSNVRAIRAESRSRIIPCSSNSTRAIRAGVAPALYHFRAIRAEARSRTLPCSSNSGRGLLPDCIFQVPRIFKPTRVPLCKVEATWAETPTLHHLRSWLHCGAVSSEADGETPTSHVFNGGAMDGRCLNLYLCGGRGANDVTGGYFLPVRTYFFLFRRIFFLWVVATLSAGVICGPDDDMRYMLRSNFEPDHSVDYN